MLGIPEFRECLEIDFDFIFEAEERIKPRPPTPTIDHINEDCTKEERRKVLQISVNKLNQIGDPDSNLFTLVLATNTKKRLQQEEYDDQMQQHQLYDPCLYHNDNILKNKDDFDAKMAEMMSTLQQNSIDVFGMLEEEAGDSKMGQKRTFDEVEDCSDEEVVTKRRRFEEQANNNELSTDNFKLSFACGSTTATTSTYQETTINGSSFSCGHSSWFSEVQSNVYNGFIGS